jgi:nucleoside-diphosphate-sugar epimerase
VASSVARHLTDKGVPVLALPSTEIDLTAPASVDQLAGLLRVDDALIFVSALTPDRGKDIATMMQNLQMGQHVCAALAERPCAHIVYVSTDAVYHDETNLARESSRAEPSSYHGRMHTTREHMLIETAKASETPLALLRPSLLYGTGDTHNGYGPNRFVRAALAGNALKLFGNGEEQRDHVDVGDVATVTGLMLDRRSTGVLNIATGTSLSFRKAAEIVAGILGSGVEIQPSARVNPIVHRHFDISALLTAFPAFQPVPLADGLAQMIRELQTAE